MCVYYSCLRYIHTTFLVAERLVLRLIMPRNDNLSLILENLTNVIGNLNRSNETSQTESFAFNNVIKYNGSNIKSWISNM